MLPLPHLILQGSLRFELSSGPQARFVSKAHGPGNTAQDHLILPQTVLRLNMYGGCETTSQLFKKCALLLSKA